MHEKKLKLESVRLKGFKSINRSGQTITFQDITILLEANGSGKSNLVSFFSMLNYMMRGSLQTYIGENGSAETLLYYGSKETTRIEAEITCSDAKQKDIYKFIRFFDRFCTVLCKRYLCGF